MLPYFMWAGTDSRTKGIVVNEYPPRISPRTKTKEIYVPGRSGGLTMTEGTDVYRDYILPCKCMVLPTTDIETVVAWLKGAGNLVFGDYPNRSIKARVDEEIVFERILRGRKHRGFTIPFVCQPGRYVYPAVADIVKTTSGSFITNLGTMISQPKIKVVGKGGVTLTVGTSLMSIAGPSSWTLVIDSEIMDCFDSTMTVLRNDWLTGEMPMLRIGANPIAWTGSVTSVTITPRWRYL